MNVSTSGLIPKRNGLNVETLKSPSLSSHFHQNTLSEWTIKTIRRASKWFILAKIWQKLEFVSLKYIVYTQPILTLHILNLLSFPFREQGIGRSSRGHLFSQPNYANPALLGLYLPLGPSFLQFLHPPLHIQVWNVIRITQLC